MFLISHTRRLYELVNDKHEDTEEKQGKGGMEGIGSFKSEHKQVKEEDSSSIIQSEGERGQNIKREWDDEDVRGRVMCLSALVPVLAAYPTLHLMANSGQFHVCSLLICI